MTRDHTVGLNRSVPISEVVWASIGHILHAQGHPELQFRGVGLQWYDPARRRRRGGPDRRVAESSMQATVPRLQFTLARIAAPCLRPGFPTCGLRARVTSHRLLDVRGGGGGGGGGGGAPLLHRGGSRPSSTAPGKPAMLERIPRVRSASHPSTSASRRIVRGEAEDE